MNDSKESSSSPKKMRSNSSINAQSIRSISTKAKSIESESIDTDALEMESLETESIKMEPCDDEDDYFSEIYENTSVDNSSIADDKTNDNPNDCISKEGVKISNLNQECLVQIMSSLEFHDLLNVANATKGLRAAAREIYVQMYVDKLVSYYNGDAIHRKGLEIVITGTTIHINDARSCLKMLRGFGAVIKRLKLNFNGIGPRRCQAIERAFVQYCPKTLIELEWYGCRKDAMKNASKKFIKLKSLRIMSGCLGEEMSLFTYFFPNLQRLQLTNVEVTNRKCIEITFPNLTHLKVSIEMRKGMDFLKSNVKVALDLNPQLISFSLGAGCDVKILSYINDRLPRLQTFEIENPRKKFFDTDEDRVLFETVNHFYLNIIECTDSFKNIPFHFNRLKTFQLNACSKNRSEWIDFVTQNPKLIRLNLLNFHWFCVLNENQMMKIAHSLPKLKEFILEWRVSSTEVMIRFLNECKTLEKIRLSLRCRPERAALHAQIGNGWNIDIDEHFMTLLRIKQDDKGEVFIVDNNN